MGQPVTIEDVIRMTAEDLKEICALPVQLAEEVRYRIAMDAKNLDECLKAIDREKQAAAAKAEAKAAEDAAAAPQAEPAEAWEAGADEE